MRGVKRSNVTFILGLSLIEEVWSKQRVGSRYVEWSFLPRNPSSICGGFPRWQ